MSALQVSIVAFNNADTITDCLASVLSECRGMGVEWDVSVVDNSPDEETASAIAKFPPVRLVRPGENLGFGRGHNLVLRAWSADRYLILNPDAILQPGSLASLMRALDRNRDVALVGPRVEYEENWPQVSFGPFPSFWKDLFQRSFTRAVQRQDPYVLEKLERRLAAPFRPDWISGSCFLGRREDLQRVNGFDDSFFLYLEDVDLCKRLRAHDRLVMVEPAAVCRHIEGHSFDDDAGPQPHFRRSRLLYENRHGSRSGFWLYQSLRGKEVSDVRYESSRRWRP